MLTQEELDFVEFLMMDIFIKKIEKVVFTGYGEYAFDEDDRKVAQSIWWKVKYDNSIDDD